MLLIGYLYGIRSERRLVAEVHLNLAYRWFCRLGLEGRVPDRAQQIARNLSHTEKFAVSRRKRKKVEILFAHLKRNLGFTRLRLRGLRGAEDEFLLAATAQNLKRLAKLVPA